MRPRVVALSAALALLVGIVCVWLLTDPSRRELDPPRDVRDPAQVAIPPADAPESAAPVPIPAPARERGEARFDANAAAPPIPQQGFRGVVVDEAGRPLEGVAVHLLESPANEPLALPWILQQRLPLGPLTSVTTAGDGTFAIGLPVAQDKVFELFLTDRSRAAVRVGNLRMRADEWADVGALTMVPGARVFGRVTMEGSGAPVPGAVVSVEVGTAFVDAALRALPAASVVLSTVVDSAGRFELHNTPRLGVVHLSAVAHGFARVVRGNVNLSGKESVEVDLVLPPGLVLRGRVAEERGGAIADARIEAWPRNSSASPLVATSDRDGRFTVQNLGAATYDVRVVARGFQDHEQRDVAPNGEELLVFLQQCGTVRVRALTRGGAVVRDYEVSLCRFLPENDNRLAFVSDVPEQRVRLDGATDAAVVTGIPAGTFLIRVACDGYANTFSPPFAIDATRRTVDLDVVLTTGATLLGQVLDEAGRPLANATVTTEPDGALTDSPTWRALAAAAPARITATSTTTDAMGSFRLPLLALGDYQLDVRHPQACRRVEPGIRLDTEGERTLAPMRLSRGTLVTGRATIGGAPASRMKIVLTSPSNAASRPGEGLRIETLAAADGFFQLPMRVPPGMYELRAAVVDTSGTQGGHFRHLQQLQRSATTVAVAAGQDRIERDIDLPNDR